MEIEENQYIEDLKDTIADRYNRLHKSIENDYNYMKVRDEYEYSISPDKSPSAFMTVDASAENQIRGSSAR